MGEVFEAEDTRLRRRVAIKLLPAGNDGRETARHRLLREARAIAGITHPNVCAIYEVGEADGRGFIAMEFVDGETLALQIASGGITGSDVLRIGIEMADALEAVHRHGVIHRDVKPSNVMITREGRVKLLDFGIAKATRASDMATTDMCLTIEGTVVGTPAYMSPEQLRGEALDARSDVFSLGVVLYETAEGKRPFERGNPLATVSAILMDDPPSLQSGNSRWIENILRQALAKDPARRFRTAGELRDALLQVRDKLDRGGVAEVTDRAGVTETFSTPADVSLILTPARLRLAPAYANRMLELAATSAGWIRSLRSEWLRVCIDGYTLRLFCGHPIVLTLEGKYAWFAIDPTAITEDAKFGSWSWDDADTRPRDARGKPYPRYAKPPSRNGWYNPAADPTGSDLATLLNAHTAYLRRAAVEANAPLSTTKHEASIAAELARLARALPTRVS